MLRNLHNTGVWSSGMILALGDIRVHLVEVDTSMREALGSIPSSPLLFIAFTEFFFRC